MQMASEPGPKGQTTGIEGPDDTARPVVGG